MTKIAFAGTFAGQLAEPVRERLAERGAGPVEIILDEEAAIARELADCDVLVSMGFDKAMAQAAPDLKLVQVPGAGLDRIDLSAVPAHVQLANVYGHEAGIAEYVIGAMIALTRSFAGQDAALRRGAWESQFAVGRPPPPLLPELGGKMLAILGYGHIGQAVAMRVQAFGMEVVAMRRRVQAAGDDDVPIMGPEAIDEMVAAADYVVVTLPLSDATRGLIDARRFGLMKPTAYLVNVGRGEIVDEKALYDALRDKTIAGAAIDVWYRYPTTAEATMPSALPFHELDNVLMTPHASGWTEGMMRARAEVIAENVERAVKGEDVVNGVG
jgi:phosphoglycerate dehydrogenase-like enzyme